MHNRGCDAHMWEAPLGGGLSMTPQSKDTPDWAAIAFGRPEAKSKPGAFPCTAKEACHLNQLLTFLPLNGLLGDPSSFLSQEGEGQKSLLDSALSDPTKRKIALEDISERKRQSQY